MADFIFTLDVLQFFKNNEKSLVNMDSFGKEATSHSLHGVSDVSKSV